MAVDETLWIDKTGWTATADTEAAPAQWAVTEAGNGWLSEAGYPHWIAFDMGAAQTIDQIAFYVQTWIVSQVELYVSDDGITWDSAVATATWGTEGWHYLRFARQTVRHFKIVGLTGQAGETRMNCRFIRAARDHGISHYLWSIVASSTIDVDHPAAYAIDGRIAPVEPWYIVNFWQSTAACPQSLTVDMGQPETFDYLRFWPDRRWIPAPYLVTLEISDDGVSWTAAGDNLWPPVSDEDHYIHLDAPVTTRHFRLTFVSSQQASVTCAELCVGLRVDSEAYKFYRKCRPLACGRIENSESDTGLINYISAGQGGATTQILVWRTSALASYPETVFWAWDLPVDFETLSLSDIVMVVEGSKTPGLTFDTSTAFTISENQVSVQDYFDWVYAWSAESGNWTGYRFTASLMGYLRAQIQAMYSHLYHWNSLLHFKAPGDTATLTVTDHYLYLVYEKTWAEEQEGGGDEGGDEEGGWPGFGANNALLVIDLEEQRPKVGYLDDPEKLPEYD